MQIYSFKARADLSVDYHGQPNIGAVRAEWEAKGRQATSQFADLLVSLGESQGGPLAAIGSAVPRGMAPIVDIKLKPRADILRADVRAAAQQVGKKFGFTAEIHFVR